MYDPNDKCFVNESHVKKICNCMPRLQKLDVDSYGAFSAKQMAVFLDQHPNLTHVHLDAAQRTVSKDIV